MTFSVISTASSKATTLSRCRIALYCSFLSKVWTISPISASSLLTIVFLLYCFDSLNLFLTHYAVGKSAEGADAYSPLFLLKRFLIQQ
jgi:hypothetical protein